MRVASFSVGLENFGQMLFLDATRDPHGFQLEKPRLSTPPLPPQRLTQVPEILPLADTVHCKDRFTCLLTYENHSPHPNPKPHLLACEICYLFEFTIIMVIMNSTNVTYIMNTYHTNCRFLLNHPIFLELLPERPVPKSKPLGIDVALPTDTLKKQSNSQADLGNELYQRQ